MIPFGASMRTSDAGKQFIKGFEFCRLVAYKDSGGVWTNGWGNTIDVDPGVKLTQAEADADFDRNLADVERQVNEAVTVPLTQNEFDALVSIVYNCGRGRAGHHSGIIELKNGEPSTLLRRLNDGDYEAAAMEFRKWDKDNGVQVNGLTRRRLAEQRMFETA